MLISYLATKGIALLLTGAWSGFDSYLILIVGTCVFCFFLFLLLVFSMENGQILDGGT